MTLSCKGTFQEDKSDRPYPQERINSGLYKINMMMMMEMVMIMKSEMQNKGSTYHDCRPEADVSLS